MRKILAALAILLATMVSGEAFAQQAQQSKGQRMDGRSVRGAVVKNYQAKGRSTDLRVHVVRDSRSGKSVQVLAETRKSGTVRALNVRKGSGVAYETPTGLVAQSTARGQANLELRRDPGTRWGKKQPGTFSGVNSSGLSASGRSYRINSATDRRGPNTDSTYVNTQTGQTRTFRR